MTSANIQGWYYVKLTLKAFNDGTSTKVFNLSNRPLIDEATGATVYYPILVSISNIGTTTGDYIPGAIDGEIIIDDSPGSIGYERKFSDYLQRYSAIGGTVQIYSANTTLDDTSIAADFSLDWTTSIRNYSRIDNQIHLSVSEQGLPINQVTTIIDAATFTEANSAALGKYLPLIIGTGVQVKPIRTTLDINTTAPQFVYGTGGSNNYLGGATNYYAKADDGTYREVRSASAVGTTVFQNAEAYSASLSLDVFTTGTFIQHSDTSNNYIVTQVDISINGSGPDTYSGTLNLAIAEGVGNLESQGPGKILAKSSVSVIPLDASLDSGTAFDVNFTLDKALVLSGDQGFWVLLSHDGYSGSAVIYARLSAPSGNYYWLNSSFDHKWYRSSTAGKHIFKFYGVKFADTFGLVNVTQKAIVGNTLPTLNSLDLVFKVNGAIDDGGGTITGTPNAVIEIPYQVIKMLDSTAVIDFTKFSDTQPTGSYPRLIKGYFEGRAILQDVMAEICRSSGMRILRYNGSSKKFALYSWGTRRPTASVITDEDLKVTSVSQLGAETIVNRVTFNVDRNLLGYDPLLNLNNGNILSKSYTYDTNSAHPFSDLATVSYKLYGVAELQDNVFNLLSGSATTYIDSMAQFYLGVYAFPHVYVELEVPLFKYKTLETMDVIEIVHPSLPAYYGTSSNAKLPYYGTAPADIYQGGYPKRAERYRAQIESKVLNYNLGQFPTMRISARLLINPGDPT